MLRKILFSMLAVLAVGEVAYAYTVTATAVDAAGEGISYATYRIFASDNPDRAIVSDVTGLSGEIDYRLSSAGSYRLALSYVGMADTIVGFEVSAAHPDARLGDIVMHETAQQLAGVTVTAQRPLVVKQIDRIGYDVQADPMVATSSVRDILRKVPMVSVQADGTIMVNGSSAFVIYKNGRPNKSLSRNAKELFAALPASMIKRIEVITEPGAEYDAEGTSAILNIVTVENMTMKGVMGNANVNYSTGNNTPDAHIWLTTQIGKVTASAYGGYSHMDGSRTRQRGEDYTYFPETGASRRTSTESRYKGDLGFFGFEGSYELDSLNLFTAELSGYSYNFIPKYSQGLTQAFDATGAVTGSYRNALSMRRNSYFDIDASFNYQHSTRRAGETFTLSYLLSTTRQESDQTQRYSDFEGSEWQPYTGIHSDVDQRFVEHTFQADWNRPLGKIHTLNLGGKWIIRRNHAVSQLDYEGWRDVASDFEHVTDIGAVYGQYGVRLGRFNLRGGLRYEYSRLHASYPDDSGDPFTVHLSDLVPSAAVAWQMSDPSSLTLNYSASISRPGISYLNPTRNEYPGSVSQGNPDLESARRQSVKLQYMLVGRKVNFNISADYAFVNNGISPVRFITDGDVVNSTYANIGRTRSVNLSSFVQWSPFAKTRLMVNASCMYTHNSQEGLTLSRWTPNVWAQVSQELPWRLSAEASLWYGGGGLDGVYGYSRARFSQSSYHSLSLSRNFLKDDRLSVRVTLENPFGARWRMRQSEVVNGDYRQTTSTSAPHGRDFRFTISYRFGSLKAQVRKVANGIDNDDLVGRKM